MTPVWELCQLAENMVNDSPLGALSHWRRVAKIKQIQTNLTLMTPI